MKLFSNNGKGRHSSNGTTRRDKGVTNDKDPLKRNTEAIAKKKGTVRKMPTKKKVIIALSIFIGLVLLSGTSAYAIVRWEVQPFYDYLFKPGSDVLADPPDTLSAAGSFDPDNPEALFEDPDFPDFVPDHNAVAEKPNITRDENIITFMIFGIDNHGNTDVIMVAAFDTEKSTFEVASIPRDTLVNVEWNLKKANSIQPVMRNRFRSQTNGENKGMRATLEEFRNLIGFEPDLWVTINIRSFVRLIDSIGGVRFNVPVGMDWSDPDLGMTFSLSRGEQHLNGEQALGLMRYRKGYSNADLGRVNTQQGFLKAAASQILANRNSINVVDMANIFMGNVKTDIQLNHMVWLGRELLKLSSDDINFTLLSSNIDSARGLSYVAVIVDEWLEIVNTKISPLDQEITSDDVSILTRGPDRRLYVTDGNWKGDSSWGASSR